MRFYLVIAFLSFAFALGCQNAKFGEDVTKHKRGPMVISDRIIAKPKPNKHVNLRADLHGLNSEKRLDKSLDQKIAKFYEREISTFKAEPEYRKRDSKIFSLSPEEDAPHRHRFRPLDDPFRPVSSRRCPYGDGSTASCRYRLRSCPARSARMSSPPTDRR